MTWQPNPVVTIAGTDYTSRALVGATLTYGRTQTNQQPRAGYASISVADLDNASVPINLGDIVKVTLEDTASTPVTVFTGTVSDVTATVVKGNSNQGTYVRYDIIGVGPLAKLNRTLAGASGYSAENDGDRIAAILDEVYAQQWNEVTSTLTWATTNPIKTWTTWDDYIGTIDQPGLYQLAAYTSGATLANNLTTLSANSGLGVLYDTPNNRINYDDADHRQVNAANNGFWTIPVSAVAAAGLSQSLHLGDVVNTVQVAYDGGTVTSTSSSSIATYGVAAQSIQTNLANALDAADQADRYLALVDYPNAQLDTLSLPIHQPNLDNSTIDTALAVYQGQPIQVDDLPNPVGTYFSGFVEGWTWRIGQFTADLKLTVSEYGRSVVTTRWENATPTTRWNTVNATIKWQEAIVI